MSITDYPDGSTNANALVLTDDSTELQVTSGTATQSGVISENGGSFGLEKIGSGTLIYTGANTYTGVTTISDGALAFSNPDSFVLGAIGGTGSVDILSGYTSFAANASYTGGTTINSGATLEIGGTFGALTGNIVDNGTFAPIREFDGAISGSGIVHIRSAISPIILGGVSTFTGATQLDQNAYLVVTGSIANSTINLSAYNQLGGTGTVGATTVGSSSDLAPGVAPGAIGTLSIAGDLTIASGGYAVDLVPGSADKVQVSGATTIATDSVLSIAVAANVTYTPGVYTILSSVGNLSGQFSYVNYSYYGNFSSGIVPFISYDAHNVYLTLSQEKTWSSSPGTNLFASTANWANSAAPGSGETAVFGGSSITTIAINGPVTIGGMRFAGGFPRFTFNVAGAGGLTINNTGIEDPTFSDPAFNVANGSSLTFMGFATSDSAVINVAQGGVLFYSGEAYAGIYTTIKGPDGVLDVGGISEPFFAISNGQGAIGTIDLGGKTLLVTGGATVAANIVDDSLSNGSHPSTVRITGGGVIFTGTSTYTGGTTIDSNGALYLGNNGTTGSIGGNVADDGLLSFEHSNTISYGGVISGAGRVTQAGGGATTLLAVNTYIGATTVSGGTLLVDGAIASSAVTVEGGGSLGGSGTVGTTSIQAGGTLAPGDGIGTLQVNGNFTLASGATQAEEFSPATADEIIVAGNANIAGNLTANFSGSGYIHQTYTILHSTGTLSGTFANFSATGLPAGVAALLTYGAHDVTLAIDHAPTVTTATTVAAQGQSLALSSLFSVSDADGDTMTRYQLWDSTRDPNSGYFVVNGVAQAAATIIDVTAAQLAQTSFVAGSVGDFLQIRAFDGYAWSAADNASWSPFTVSIRSNTPPQVTTATQRVAAGQSVALSSLAMVTDADGDTITRYQLWDSTRDPNSGHWVINGVAQAAGTIIDVSAAQLAQTFFLTGTVNDSLQIRAFDGIAWSASDTASWAPFTIGPLVDNAPVVQTSNRIIARGVTTALSNLITVSDADGDAMTAYQLWDGNRDPNSGHFVVNGQVQAAGTVIDITAAQLAQTSFVTGSLGDSLQVRAFDGISWSAADTASWSPFTVSVPDAAPVVTTNNVTRAHLQSYALSSLFSVSDADGDAMTEYQLWDGSRDPNSGHFVVNGQVQAAGTVIDITAAQLAQTSFVTGSLGDSLQIRAFDGIAWSALDTASWAPFALNIPANSAPVVSTGTVNAVHGRALALSSLFSVTDADGDAMTEYQLWDSTRDPLSGHFVINGVAQAAATVIDITAAQLAQTSFLTGTVGDNLQIRAFDGISWSAADTASWAPFAVNIPANSAPVVSTGTVNAMHGRTLALSSLFSVTDADGDSMTRYQLWDSTRDPLSGHFVVNGVAQAAATVIDITAAQLNQTSFVTGQVSDSLQIRAFDGTDWSDADNASWNPFTVAVTPYTNPSLSTQDVSATAGQSLALSGLINVSDPDGDSMTKYELWDSTRDPNSGSWVVNGQVQSASMVIDITAAQLAQTSFLTGAAGITDSLQVRAFDGINWTAADTASWAPFHVTAT